MKKLALLVFVLLFLMACTKYARLYPVNDLASTTGVLKAKYSDYGTGYGEITIVMPDGETLSGEYTTGRAINLNFGNILSNVYGTEGGAFGTGTSTSFRLSDTSPGIANLYSDRGTMMQCEYFIGKRAGKGRGACKKNDGSLYRLEF
ncbi:MAG: hypothetical protein ABFR35_10955 [Thermodesulfobacteriota bacterium]